MEVNIGDRVTLNAVGSSDAEGSALSFSWYMTRGEQQVALNGAQTMTPWFIAPADGLYEFTVTASDECGASDTDTVRVSVGSGEARSVPIARAYTEQSIVSGGTLVTIDASMSEDPDDGQLAYSWRQTGGETVNLLSAGTVSASFTAPMVGQDTKLIFELTVSNGADSDTDTIEILVKGGDVVDPLLPVADAGTDQTVDETTLVSLNGSGSTDPEGGQLSYAWSQTSGPTVALSDAKIAEPTFMAPDVGCDGAVLIFELTVSNGTMNATDSVQITVRNVAGSNEAFNRFYELVDKAKADRVGDVVGTYEVSRGPTQEETNQAGNQIAEYTEVTNRKTSALSNLVMMDNTIGKVYPGSLLWAAAVRDGQLHQLEQIPNRPLVTTSFSGLHNIQPAPSAVIFTHDGSYSDFMSHAAPVFGAAVNGGTRLVADFKISSSLKDALLSIGLSASYWGAKMEAGLEHIQNERRSIGVMTLDQVFYSAAVDSPPAEGFVPSRLLQCDSQLASVLAEGAVMGGEIAYVRKVDYGRRVLVSLSSAASSEELNMALKTAVDWATGHFSGEVDSKTKEVWQSVEGKLIIIGGSYPDGVSGFFGGDIQSFVRAIQAIMSQQYVNDSRGALPVSFELGYVNDNAPMQVYETIEFAGKIPGRRWGRVITEEDIETNSKDAAVIRQDGEIDSDDWTMVELTSQTLQLSSDRRTIHFTVTWHAYEGEKNKTISSYKTIIRSSKTFSHEFNKPVREILSPTSVGAAQQWYAGKVHTQQQFPNHGLLRNIRVLFDGPGGQDQEVQLLNAKLSFEIWLEE